MLLLTRQRVELNLLPKVTGGDVAAHAITNVDAHCQRASASGPRSQLPQVAHPGVPCRNECLLQRREARFLENPGCPKSVMLADSLRCPHRVSASTLMLHDCK